MLDKIEARDVYIAGGLICLMQLPKVISMRSDSLNSNDSIVSRVMNLFGLNLTKIQPNTQQLGPLMGYPLGFLSDNLLISCMAYSLLKPSSLPAISRISSKTLLPVSTLIFTMTCVMDIARRKLLKNSEETQETFMESEIADEDLSNFPEVEINTVVMHPRNRVTLQSVSKDLFRKNTSSIEPDLIRTSSPVKGLNSMTRVPTHPSFIDQRSFNQKN